MRWWQGATLACRWPTSIVFQLFFTGVHRPEGLCMPLKKSKDREICNRSPPIAIIQLVYKGVLSTGSYKTMIGIRFNVGTINVLQWREKGTGQRPWLSPGWTILPIGVGYCSNTSWTHRFRLGDNKTGVYSIDSLILRPEIRVSQESQGTNLVIWVLEGDNERRRELH